VSIILLTEDKSFYEFHLCFDLARVTLTPLRFITKMKEEQIMYESHLTEDLTLSLLSIDKKYGFGSLSYLEAV
jgi:hypothetical protein